MRTGDFATLSQRHHEGVILQIFSPEGKLRSYTRLPIDINEAVIDHEGNVYSVSYIFPEDLEKEGLLRAFSSDGNPLPLEAMREQLASFLKEMKPQFLGTPVACCDGALHVPVYCRSSTETIAKLITITKSGSMEVSDLSQLVSYPVCLPGCELGIVEFSSDADSVTDSGIVLRRKSGTKIMQASLKEDDLDLGGLEYRFLLRPWSLVAKHESLILFISAKYKGESATLGFPVNATIMVMLDSQGKALKLGQFDTPVGSHNVWDTDSEGNIYYLAFTKEGTEMRKLVIR